MSIDTDFNVNPYYDDFDEDKNFHRVLFKPAVAVQARELTQMQSILQNQIERFGDNILKEGTIVKGCNFVEIRNIGYVKLLDLNTSSQPVSMASYIDARAVGGTSGIEAKIILVDTGLETQAPDLNTVYVKYLTTGSGGEKVFGDTEQITIKNFDTGEVIDTVVAAGSVDASPVGKAYGVRVGDGIIYQKGNFVRVEAQKTVVSKYSNVPDSVVVGFQTIETIINSNADTSLLDNAQGFNNYNAPGADRLKLTATLVKKTLTEAEDDETFFAIQEYEDGLIVRRNKTTQYAGIMDAMEQRTKEESGDYTVKDFSVSIEAHSSNTDLLDLQVGNGKAYVDGKRVHLLNAISLDLPKASDYETENSQTINTNIGHYILVDELAGNFDPHICAEIDLYDTVQGSVTAGGVPVSPTGNSIGSAKIRAVTYHSGTVGANTAQYRAYIFDVKMDPTKNFNDVAAIYYAGQSSDEDGCADLVSTTIYDSDFKRAIFPVGRDGIKTLPSDTTADVSTFISRNVDDTLQILADETMNITLTGTDEWAMTGELSDLQKQDILIIPKVTHGGYTAGIPVDLDTANVNVSGATMSFADLPAATSPVSVIVYYNVKKSFSQPAGKDLKTVYIKIDCANNVSNTDVGLYSLGIADVISIENIYVNSGSYAETNDNKGRFVFNNGQTDTHYGHATIKKRKNYTLTTADRILVKAKVFQRNVSGGEGYFSVNSYPIDDANTANTSAITTQEIPIYEAENGDTYDLRNSVDFRPHQSNTAVYATTAGAATINPPIPSSSQPFGTSNLYVVSPNEDFNVDYDYYLARKDKLVLNPDGDFKIRSGEPAENPAPPSEPNRGMVIADIDIPVYPSLPKLTADQAGRPELGVRKSKRVHKRYTMRDIGAIEKRIDNIEYYTMLNALENDTKDLVIPDSSGNNRFKNGIFIDNFESLAAAKVNDPNYSAGIDPTTKELTPKFTHISLDLKPTNTNNWSNVTDHDEVATLDSDREWVFISQYNATTFRNCVTDFYKYNGVTTIYPKYDSGYDTTRAPEVNIDIDLGTPFAEYTTALGQYVPLSTTTSNVVTTSVSSTNTTATSVITTTATKKITKSLTTDLGSSTKQKVGDFVTDVNFSPFLRGKVIRIRTVGLRPNTRHYVFFDGKNVNEHCARASILDDSPNNFVRHLSRNSKWGKPLFSDSNGKLEYMFRIPAGTFFVGDRTLEVYDVASLNDVDAQVSSSVATYHGFNYSVEKTGLTVTTRTPVFSQTTKVDKKSTSNTAITRIPIVHGDPEIGGTGGAEEGGTDPIAQTFRIKRTHSRDNVIMLTSIDLAFKTKSSTRGVTVEIRETINGYPSKASLPFSRVRLEPSDVNVSTNGSEYTTFTFDAPIAVSVGKEYCFVVMPDANDPDYNVFVAKVGQKGIQSGKAITQDTHTGVLFTSTNNSAWTPYQDENIKFRLRRSSFVSSGTMYLTNKNTEFLTVDVTGTFREGETVYVRNANVDGTATANTESKTITGTGFDVFEAGDWIGIYNANNDIDVLRVKTVTSNTSINTYGYPKYDTTATAFIKTVKGVVTYFDRETPAQLYLDSSSAKSGTFNFTDSANNSVTANNYFAAGDTIVGEDSEASGTISSVDDLNVSYVQPNIYRNDFKNTNTKISFDRLLDSANTNYSKNNVAFNDDLHLYRKATKIRSKTNEVLHGGGADSFRIKLDLENTTPGGKTRDASPFIDHDISSIGVYRYEINNTLDDGTTTENDAEDGPAESKYVSKTVKLANRFDASDLKVYLTAHRPPGTNLAVYVRFKNQNDPRPFGEIEWTRLERKGETNAVSSAANRQDYNEYEYYVDSQAAGSFTSGGGAALNTTNSDILRYHDEDGVIYDTYKHFAIKIVLRGTSHKNVPRVKDVRAIALT